MSGRNVQFLVVLVVGVLLGAVGFTIVTGQESDPTTTPSTVPVAVGSTTTADSGTTTTPSAPASTTTTTTLPDRQPGTVPGWTVGQPWGTTVGLTMFRGNPTRSFYGAGPVPDDPSVEWAYPDSPMCRESSSGGETKVWCGNGWTGQPIVWEHDGVTEVIFGAYDGAVHFVDAATGEELRQPFQTGDIIKGTVTLDPDGYPLLYFGSRDNKLRILALDRKQPEQLWSLDASAVDGIWNDDWDSNPVIVDDVMYEGGENGWFFATVLNREYLDNGKVNVDPDIVFMMPGYDDELISKSGTNVSIETSVAVYEERVYFANSGGRVVGLDVSQVREGKAPIVFDYYAGGDIDATIVVDEQGMLYVSIEHEPSQMGSVELDRNLEVGQLVKLDPYKDGDPRLWGLDLTTGGDSGLFATPALHAGILYVNTHTGDLIAVDAKNGDLLWSDRVGEHSWSSPAVVEGHLVVAACAGDVRSYSLDDPRQPVLEWSVDLGGSCLEATPAVWKGHIYIGSRDGYVRSIG